MVASPAQRGSRRFRRRRLPVSLFTALVEWGKANPTAFFQRWSRLAPKDAPEGGSGMVRIAQLHLDALRHLPRIEAVARIEPG